MDFKAFPKIERIDRISMSITQKIHGTNASIHIFKNIDGTFDVRAGSRTRWITPKDDNYGFAAYVETNKSDIIAKLGVNGEATYFGEWAGPGINSGEGLTERKFILFDYWKFPPERELPLQMMPVPVLFNGKLELETIDNVMNDLKVNGSKLVPGFMRPEGVVIQIMGIRYKRVFDREETKWTRPDKEKVKVDGLDVSHLLQPIRMEKLLSRDESYIREYPKSLPIVCKAYLQDLMDEGQLTGDEAYIKGVRKALGRDLFALAKEIIEKA